MLLIPTKVKVVAACVALGAAFFSGWKVAAWKADAALKAAHEAQSAELAEAIRQGREERSLEVERERIRRSEFERRAAAAEAANAVLREDIANARLSLPETRTPAEVDNEGVLTCPNPLASPDFVRLWNNASGRNH